MQGTNKWTTAAFKAQYSAGGRNFSGFDLSTVHLDEKRDKKFLDGLFAGEGHVLRDTKLSGSLMQALIKQERYDLMPGIDLTDGHL